MDLDEVATKILEYRQGYMQRDQVIKVQNDALQAKDKRIEVLEKLLKKNGVEVPPAPDAPNVPKVPAATQTNRAARRRTAKKK